MDNRLGVGEVALMLPIKRIEDRALKSAPKKLSPQERLDMIIELVRNEPIITRESICESLRVSVTTLRKDLEF